MFEDSLRLSSNISLDRFRKHELLDAVRIRKPTLVLDLDDTLICTFPLPLKLQYFQVRIKQCVFIATRPGLQKFLAEISKIYEVFIFTYAEKEYADKVLDIIAPEIDLEHRLYRDQCVKIQGYSVKDLRMIQRPLSRIILVDDTPSCALLQPPNLIHILPYQGDTSDTVLLDELLPTLQHCAKYTNTAEAAFQKVSNKEYPSLSTIQLL